MAELSTLGSVIKTAYEGEADTNAFDDAAVAALASALQPGANISTLTNDAGYEANVALASQAEAEAGTENTKTMTALRVAQAISALAGGGGIGGVSEDTSPTLGGDLSLGGYKLLSGASNNAVVKLGDNAGTRKLSITDSDEVEVANIDSNGLLTLVRDGYSTQTLSVGFSGTSPSINTSAAASAELLLGSKGTAHLKIGGTSNYQYATITGNSIVFRRNEGGSYPVSISAFDGTSERPSSPMSITAGSAGSSNVTNVDGGSLTLAGGNSASGSGNGGDVILTPGTGTSANGRVRFGTHASIAAETVTGYITIKDAGGTERKLAVVS